MPTLGEIAAINQATFAGQETDPAKIALNYKELQRRQLDITKGEREIKQQDYSKQLNRFSSLINSPVWKEAEATGDYSSVLGELDNARKDLHYLTGGVQKGGPLDRAEKRLLETGDLRGAFEELNLAHRQLLQPSERPGYAPPKPFGEQLPTQTKQNVGQNIGNDGEAIQQNPNKIQFSLKYPKRDASREPYRESVAETREREEFDTTAKATFKGFDNSYRIHSDIRNTLETVNRIKQQLIANNLDPDGIAANAWARILNRYGLDADYQELVKNLKRSGADQSLALGYDTDASRQLGQAISGEAYLSPKVLEKIAMDMEADQVHIDKKAQSMDYFARAYGESNVRAFKREWNANADRRVFQIFAIDENVNLSADEKRLKIEKILGTGPQRDILLKKYQNIYDMSIGRYEGGAQ